MEHWDVCVIGGGPAGYAAAMRAVDFGKRVLLVERHRIGGAGIFDGALSSKALWELSQDIADYTRRFDVRRAKPRIAFDTVAEHVGAAVTERSGLLVKHLEAIRAQRPGTFAWEQGEGRLADAHTVEVRGANGTRQVRADHIVLATGSRPRVLPTIPVDEKIILTSDGISGLTDFPKSIVVLGAGVIGCEFATIFSNFGQTQVNPIDKEPRILPFEDEDVAGVIQDNLEAAGVLIHHGCKLVSMGVEDGQVAYVVEHTEDGRKERFVTERALISVGRVPNVEGLGLAEAGVQCSASGHIVDHG
ncbi:MAG TPA: FAD-dependent oxidoreductase, partial [bacterium]